MVTKISKWSRIQDFFRNTPKIESLVACAIPDIPSKFQKNPSITFWVILLTHRQIDRQTNKVRQKHNLLGGGNKLGSLLLYGPRLRWRCSLWWRSAGVSYCAQTGRYRNGPARRTRQVPRDQRPTAQTPRTSADQLPVYTTMHLTHICVYTVGPHNYRSGDNSKKTAYWRLKPV